jgi:short subunit dehydrogenase-like uncharacterized protein
MIYGATGYTGRLVTDRAVARGLRPILAGRSPAVEALAARHGLPSRVFDLRDPQTVREAVAGCGVVAHCAGPFSATSDPMVDACLAAGTDYVDITGEIEVFEAAQRRDADARATGVVLCPGVGFDVMPTHCIAATLAEALPGATHLALGFETAGGMSAGTAKTTIEGLPRGGRVAVARLRTANVYDVTAAGVLLAVEHLLDRDGPGGFFTPSRLIGPRCVESLPGSGRIEIEVRGP